MKITTLFAESLLCCAIVTNAFTAELKKPGPSPSDALFDPSRVIQIDIRLDPKDWHALRTSHRVYDGKGQLSLTERGYQYYRGDVLIDGQSVKSVGIRKKGTGSESTVKPAFKIKFDQFVKKQEFSELEMLTFNNLSEDLTKAQQSLIYSFMNKAGAIAPRANLARIVVNGEDLGIYGHVESIDKRFVKRHFTNARGDLYEGQYGADFTTNAFNKLIHKWGRDEDLTNVRKLVDMLASPGPLSVQSIEELINLDAFIKFWAATVLLGNTDSYPGNANNYYAYRDANSGRFFLLPWGADAWGFDRPNAPPGTQVPKSVWMGGHLCWRLWNMPEIQDRYRKEMRRLLADVWDEKTLLAELNQIKRLCHDSLPPKGLKWGVESIVQFIQGQRAAVEAELDGPPPEWPFHFSGPRHAPPVENQRPPMEIEGSFSAVIAEAFPTNAVSSFGQGAATLQFTIRDETRKPFGRFGAVAVLRREENRIQIVAKDDAAALDWRILFRLDPYRAPITPGTVELGYWGYWNGLALIFQDKQFRPGVKNTGTLELTQTSTNLGGTISGKFTINTTAFEDIK